MDPVTSGMDPTVALEPFTNTSIPTGGDSRLYNLNVFYNVSLPGEPTLAIRGANGSIAGRHRLDDHINCARALDDSGCRVSRTMVQNWIPVTDQSIAFFILDWHGESPHYRYYGFR